MLLSTQLPTLPAVNQHAGRSNAASRLKLRIPLLTVGVMARESGEGSRTSAVEDMAIVEVQIATLVICWSLYTLKTTGCGLPPGPGGSMGALEGLIYLVAVGIVAWSLYTKNKMGTGLPNGPFVLLGAVEGLSYVSLLAVAIVFGLRFLEHGSIPGRLPSAQCFG